MKLLTAIICSEVLKQQIINYWKRKKDAKRPFSIFGLIYD
ncbi:hypothetical protein EAVNNN508_01678 [Elizabethkingia anophelis]|nr:hypothetical protein EAVNVH72_03534 [Elizabethkingia anophelis]CAH1147546.1 hypothetical protein EAVNVB490_02819 [Elizabethkingia anophelis]CAI9671327.1 hypothetical protein EAVNNN508_02413 [Elizabethkingia anophelis]CAI9674300.1 hypothetical protein EAVNVB490_01681 [Elizabethkingia anophelis]CAI9681243.1 hypothetical protein EAVNVH72_01616 [Elizabethkingia anophelis]